MPADQGAPERQESLMYVGSPFVANAQTPELKQPGKGSFYHPPPSAQSTAMLGVAFGKETARCGEHADLAGSLPRHSPGHLARNQGDDVVVHALPAGTGWRQRVQEHTVNHGDWLP
jgi:hypothetical protein